MEKIFEDWIKNQDDIEEGEGVFYSKEIVMAFAEHYQALQLLQPGVSGQSGQFYCFNVKFSDSPHKCIKQCEICKPKNI